MSGTRRNLCNMMSTSPEFATFFAEEVRRHFNIQKPETFWNCGPGLTRFVANGFHEAWVNAELRTLSTNVDHLGRWALNEVTLHRDSGCTLSITLFEGPQRYIHALPFLGLYIPLQTSLVCDRYELPEGYRNDVFDASVKLQPAGSFTTSPGEIAKLESGRYVYDWRISEPLIVLRLITPPLQSLEWLFSRSTLHAWQANDADLRYTQMRVAAYVLGKIAHQSSIPPLRHLADHSHHAVRWAAIQSLGRLNRSEAMIKIRAAVHDKHPHVRRAAQKTLERLDGKPGGQL